MLEKLIRLEKTVRLSTDRQTLFRDDGARVSVTFNENTRVQMLEVWKRLQA